MLRELFSSSRFWSLAWRMGGMALAFVLSAVATHLSALQLDTNTTIFIGLVIGEITKALNNKLSSSY